MTFCGPLIVLAFYVVICVVFLARPVPYGIATSIALDARACFYAWFILVVFMLDWARAGMANIEASALMHPRIAPKTAMQLMWHTDCKWANPLWWFRAMRAVLLHRFKHQAKVSDGYGSRPSLLWAVLSITTLLIFTGLPLSGLTMELVSVMVYSDQSAIIRGPNGTTFNIRMATDPMRQIQSTWQTGRSTEPSGGAIVYAPHGTENVSTTYFEDQISEHVQQIEFFTGPAVSETVYGEAWGMRTNVSCSAVPKEELYMLQIDDFDYSVRRLLWTDEGRVYTDDGRALTEWVPASSGQFAMTEFFCTWDCWPLTYQVENLNDTDTPYWLVVVADGYEQRFSPAGHKSPYLNDSNHDTMTFDSMANMRPDGETTTAILEMFLWQSHIYDNIDADLDQMTSGSYHQPVALLQNLTSLPSGNDADPKTLTYAGVSIHCEIQTAVGYAELDAARRTFSSFRAAHAEPSGTAEDVGYDMWPPQVFAVELLTRYADSTSSNLFQGNTPFNPRDQTFDAFHTATNKGLLPAHDPSDAFSVSWPALTPEDLQTAAYRLLGQGAIAMMDAGGLDEWTGDLKTLKPSLYLAPGVLSWKWALALLSAWALIMCTGALWMLVGAGPRWAPSLDGFEMFKFGAQFPDDVHTFKTVDFPRCGEALTRLPGMVGMLPGSVITAGDARGMNQDNKEKMGFIGLSENVASKDALYSLDRSQAQRFRF